MTIASKVTLFPTVKRETSNELQDLSKVLGISDHKVAAILLDYFLSKEQEFLLNATLTYLKMKGVI
jgi:hypothetical protein